ncbi:MAG: flagellar hook-length control protein FliK [Candidatus Zixiibacteriota bacterium]
MNNSGNNIINLLLGVTGGEINLSDNVVSGNNGKTSSFLPFATFFNPLIEKSRDSYGQNPVTPENAVTPENFDFLLGEQKSQGMLTRESDLLNHSLESGIDSETSTVKPELLFDARQTITGEMTDFINTAGLDLESLLNNNVINHESPSEIVVPDAEISESAGLNLNENVGLPLETYKTNRYLNDIINRQQIKLADGDYNIIEAKTVDAQLNLTVQAKDNPAHQIKITLPADQLQTLMSGKENGQQKDGTDLPLRTARVDAGISRGADRTVKIDDLFAKLDLKELQIKTSETGAAKVAPDAMTAKAATEVKIVADNAGQEVIIKGKINNYEIKTLTDRENSRTAVRDGSRVLSEVDGEELSVKAEKADNQQAQRLNRSVFKTGNTVDDFNLLKNLSREKTAENSKNDTPRLFQEVTLEQLPRAAQNQSVRTVATPVRFTLPENVARTLQPNGRSVTLKIEPDYLGTARLHLTMRNDSLAARVTVDNIPAKNALESSLHQLTEQLNKSGIQVDYIEVNVSGEEARERAFSRTPHWNRSSHTAGFDTDGEVISDLDKITPSLAVPVSYVGAGGVNIFA